MTVAAGNWPHLTVISVIDIVLVAIIIYEFLSLIRSGWTDVMLPLCVEQLVETASGESEAQLREVAEEFIWHLTGKETIYQMMALARLGRRLTFTHGSVAEGDAYDDIVMAANLFSQNQTGALIVIQREIGLRTYVESGVAIDAQLSYDLLATIFRPSAPLHDGAVIIHGDRILAAACFLPLSMNPVLSTQMGTRHRAGIGITEETDAIAVIVSEETGGISLAVAGTIERDLTVEQLRDRMGTLLRRYVPPTPCGRPSGT